MDAQDALTALSWNARTRYDHEGAQNQPAEPRSLRALPRLPPNARRQGYRCLLGFLADEATVRFGNSEPVSSQATITTMLAQ